MYFAELLFSFMFSPSNENKLSVDQLPHNSIVIPLTQMIFQIPGETTRLNNRNVQFCIHQYMKNLSRQGINCSRHLWVLVWN